MVLQSPPEQSAASVDDIERYEVIDSARVARELMGAFETVLASWLCHLISILQRTDTFEPKPIHAVVVRTWNGHEYGHEGKMVLLTPAPVDKPLQPFDDDDARRLIENCGIKEAEQPWDLGHPPQKTEQAVLVHIVFTVLTFALATAYRLPCEQEATGGEPVGWMRWRRQLIEQTWDKVIVFAQEWYGIFPIAEFTLLAGVKLNDVPPGIGTLQEMLAKYRLTHHD